MTTKNDSHLQVDSIYIASEIVAAYVSNHNMDHEELPGFLKTVYTAVSGIASGNPIYGVSRTPAVPIGKSITPDYIVCLEDGKKLKMLKRYLRTHYDMSPDDYRRKWGLPADYPMTCPGYANRRSLLAKESGLGKTPKTKRGSKTARAS